MAARFCQAPGCDRELRASRKRFCSDLCRRRGQRYERITETDQAGRAVVRMITALSRRAGASDIDVLAVLWEVRDAADRATFEAIGRLIGKEGISWAVLADAVGLARHDLYQRHQRWARRFGVHDPGTAEPRPPGDLP
jgi:hypothetical protein